MMIHGDTLPIMNVGEKHIQLMLLLDISKSMAGAAMNELNEGLYQLKNAFDHCGQLQGRIDISIITFSNEANVVVGFRPACYYEPITLTAEGFTCTNQAILLGMEKLEERRNTCRQAGVECYKSILFLLSDGTPNDLDFEEEAIHRLQEAITKNKLVYVPFGIGKDVDVEQLMKYYPEQTENKKVYKACEDELQEVFTRLSNSVSNVLLNDDDQYHLNNTTNRIII